MRATITTGLGYSLLTAAAFGAVVYTHTTVNIMDVAQVAVLSAGALALMLMTRTRSTK